MLKIYKLIDRANYQINHRQYDRARKIIEEALCVAPDNLEVWEVFLQICTSRNDLEYAKMRVLSTKELNAPDEFGFFTGRDYLVRRIDTRILDFS